MSDFEREQSIEAQLAVAMTEKLLATQADQLEEIYRAIQERVEDGEIFTRELAITLGFGGEHLKRLNLNSLLNELTSRLGCAAAEKQLVGSGSNPFPYDA